MNFDKHINHGLWAISSCILISCGMAPQTITICDSNGKCQIVEQNSGDVTVDDKVDEEKPPFAEIPKAGGSNSTAQSNTNPTAPSPTAPSGSAGTGDGFGVNGNFTCSEYVAQFWKIGSQTYEEAPGPLFTKLKYTTTVLSVSGSRVTIQAKLETPDSSQNVDEQVSFDACTEGHMSAVPATNSPCKVQYLADETVTVNGISYNTKKYQLGECTLESGKTFSSIVWRAAELPLWGIVKREVTGTIVPDSLSGKISATIKTWKFN